MSFDPTKPQPQTEIDANELRAQFNGLKSIIDALPPGQQGPPGAQGVKGNTGDKGDKGDKGDRGDNGA